MGTAQLTEGCLFDIQGFSVHDGPGCRTLIFFKGCSLKCSWCSNPEGIHPAPEPLYNSLKCSLDLLCVEACPHNAIKVSGDTLVLDRKICRSCTSTACADACCTQALKKAGYFISVEELMKKIRRDRQYWGPGGGITLTGGEPFLQPEFAHDLLKSCWEAYIHTSVETCGNVPWESIEGNLEFLEWIFYDLKQIDPGKHKKATGISNETILENARRIAGKFSGRLVFRIPLIPGVNDDAGSLDALAEFIKSTGRTEVNLIPVHHMGREKYRLMGYDYYTADFSIPDSARMAKAAEPFRAAGLTCYIGSDTPF